MQTSSFRLTTGASIPSQNDHWAFGVRGNDNNASCTSGYQSFPFLGRGVAIFDTTIYFENFSNSCAGVAHVTAGHPGTLQPNTSYYVTVWANNRNVGYDIWREYVSGGKLQYAFVSSGGCLGFGGNPAVCGAHSSDSSSADRAFIANTKPYAPIIPETVTL